MHGRENVFFGYLKTRNILWTLCEGFQDASKIITRLATNKLILKPLALVEMRNRRDRKLLGLLNAPIFSLRTDFSIFHHFSIFFQPFEPFSSERWDSFRTWTSESPDSSSDDVIFLIRRRRLGSNSASVSFLLSFADAAGLSFFFLLHSHSESL